MQLSVLLGGLVLSQQISALYSPQGNVTILTPNNFDLVVKQSDQLSIGSAGVHLGLVYS